MDLFRSLLSPDFMPHGYCYLWDPRMVWLHVVSDGLITLSYYCIPVVLIYFIRKRRDLPFNWIFWMFGSFILACGTTHLMEVWNIWHASYLLAGILKAITAGLSAATVVLLIPLLPQAVAIPNLMHLREKNRKLEEEIAQRKRFDEPIDVPLRRRVQAGFIAAVLLTIFIGFSSWRGARRAEEDAYWVSHTYEVMATIQRTSRHVLQVQTSARAFALSGQELLLAHYQLGRDNVYQDQKALLRLTADNFSQQRRLDVLRRQIGGALDFADSIIAKRRKLQTYPASGDALETERLIDLVRLTIQDMHDEEARLLLKRTQQAQAGQRWTRIIAIVGALLGVGLWGLARLAVNREIDISSRALLQLGTLNAELEQRVERRTADLQSEVRERERAEVALQKALAASEAALQELADQKFALDQHAIVAITDVQGTITYVNEKFCAISQYSEDELVGQNHRMLNSGYHSQEFFQELYAAISHGKVWHGEIRNRAKDASIYWVDTTIVPFLVGGKPRQYVAIRADITERKKVEDALHEQAQVLDLAQVMVRDLQGRIVLWNAGAEKLYGFTSEEAVGQISHRLLNTEFPEPLERIEEKLIRDGSWEGELAHRRRDGTKLIVSSMWVLHRDADGRPLRVLEANTDITARRQATEQLAEQARELALRAGDLAVSRQALESQTIMLQSVLSSIAEGLVAADAQGKFLIWNPAAEKILGQGATNLPPQEWSQHYRLYLDDMVTPFPPDQVPLARAIRGEASTAAMFVRNPELNQGVWIEVSGGPLKDKNGALCGGVVAFRDITQRKADEQEIRKLNDDLEAKVIRRTAQLEAANKELEAFSYSVSHDLRAPLRHISGFSKILTEEFGPSLDPGAKHYLERIQEGTHKMGLLVDELLNLARVGRHALSPKRTALGSIVAEVIAMLKPDCEGREVDWKIADLPSVECDPVLVKQIFQNLLANALKFTRTRTPAVIEVSFTGAAAARVFMVRDNGVGFSMKYADKLFGVFQRLHRAEEFEGTGIGLATVLRIVQKHEGKVWAEAELDKGAAFYFTLGDAAQTSLKTNAAIAGGQS